MRFGILSVAQEYLEQILLISQDNLKVNVRRCTELPDDAHIISVEFNQTTRCFDFLVGGSGADLVKTVIGSTIPQIDLVIEDVDSS